jgi:hypothetical protein
LAYAPVSKRKQRPPKIPDEFLAEEGPFSFMIQSIQEGPTILPELQRVKPDENTEIEM